MINLRAFVQTTTEEDQEKTLAGKTHRKLSIIKNLQDADACERILHDFVGGCRTAPYSPTPRP
jgi:hypothetical protein